MTVLDLCIDVFTYWGFCLVFSGRCYVACRGSVAPDFGLLCAGAGALFLFLGASKGAVLDQARLRHVLDLCSYVFTYWGFFLVVSGGCYVLGLFSCSSGVPKVPFWTRRMYCFLLWLRSDLGGVRLFRVLGSDLGGVLLFRIHCQEAAVLRLSRLGCVMFFVYVLGLFSFPLGAPKVPLRTPANDHVLPRLSSDLGGVLLFRIHCQEAAVLRLSRLGCVMFFVYVLALFSSPF